MTRTHLKNAFGLHTADFCPTAFSEIIVPLVRIAPAAAVGLTKSARVRLQSHF